MQRNKDENKARLLVNRISTDERVQRLTKQMKEYDEVLFIHCFNVAFIVAQICFQEKYSVKDRMDVTTAALLHDVGKTWIDSNIINKHGELSEEEYAIVKTHVGKGVSILKEEHFNENIIRYVKEHHEKIDGSGYPCALMGDEISPFGELIATVDMYDAMTSDRPYGKIHDKNGALYKIECEQGVDMINLEYIKKCVGI